MLPQALLPLAQYQQFILYQLSPSKKRPGKTDKFPINPADFAVTNAHDSSIWMDATTAYNTASLFGDQYGVGFVFTKNDPFFFVDIDNCLEGNQWSPVAQDLMTRFNGAAVEISQSGSGLHIIGQASPIEHGCKNQSMGLELYTSDRFVALTGNGAVGDASIDCTGTLQEIVPAYFPVSKKTGVTSDWRNTPVEEWSGLEDDQQLLNKALSSSSAKSRFTGSATFSDLWNNNTPVLAKSYPSLNQVDPYDRSSADMALAQMLAFWTGKNHQRIYDLMQQSALVREKWTKHRTYLATTVTNAVNNQGGVYRGNIEITAQPVLNDITKHPEPRYTTGVQYMTANQQVEYFKGCVYVRDAHRIFIPDGSMLKPEQFKASYGGYIFAMDSTNEKTTKNAWECFTESQAVRFPQVNSTCFRPKLNPGEIIEDEGMTKVNTYIPVTTKRAKGDASLFIDFMQRLLPDERDRRILLSYMASLVRNPGEKFQWCPLIQGTEGNGKTLITRVLSYAVGHRYTHLPNAGDLAGNGLKFNSWVR